MTELDANPCEEVKNSFTDSYLEELLINRIEQRVVRELEIDILYLQVVDGTL